MASYTVRKHVPDDHRLLLEVPTEIPAGTELTVTFETAHPPGSGAALAAWLRSRDSEGWQGSGRSRDEIDAEIRELRDEWDSD